MAESPHGRFVWYEMFTVDKDGPPGGGVRAPLARGSCRVAFSR